MSAAWISEEGMERLAELAQSEGFEDLKLMLSKLVADQERVAIAQHEQAQIVKDVYRAQGARALAQELEDGLERLRRGGAIKRR